MRMGSVASAVHHAQTLVHLGTGIGVGAGGSRAGSFAPPPSKPHQGLTAEVVALIEAAQARAAVQK